MNHTSLDEIKAAAPRLVERMIARGLARRAGPPALSGHLATKRKIASAWVRVRKCAPPHERHRFNGGSQCQYCGRTYDELIAT